MKKLKFYECEICAGKPGSPPLCTACWQRRDMVEAINELVVLQGEGENNFIEQDCVFHITGNWQKEKCNQMVFRKLTEGGGYPCANPKGGCPVHEKPEIKCYYGCTIGNCTNVTCGKLCKCKESPQPVSTVECEHESDGLSYLSNPPQWKCKKCGKFSSQIENSPKFIKIDADFFKDFNFGPKDVSTVEGWQNDFLQTFYVYNLKRGSPAGAHGEALEFIEKLITQVRAEERARVRGMVEKKMKENGWGEGRTILGNLLQELQ